MPYLKSIDVCASGGYHLVIAEKKNASPVANPPLTKYGWPRKLFEWDGVVGDDKAVTWSCNSRRHAGPCQKRAGAILFNRIKHGLARLDVDELSLMVLTLPHREWATPEEAYLGIHPMWRKLMKLITRRWGDLVPVFDEETGLQKLGRPRIVGERMLLGPDGQPVRHTRGRFAGYAKTVPIVERRPRFDRKRPKALTVVEKHPGSGMPHLNVVIVCRQLTHELGPHIVQDRVTPSGRKEKTRVATTKLGKRTLRELRRIATKCGFGWALSASPVESADAVAGYMVKTAKGGGLGTSEGGEPGAAVGELAKSSQVADNAPMYFRAVRSSPGLLEPVWEEGKSVGKMVFKPAPKVKPSGYMLVRHWFQMEMPLSAPRAVQLGLPLAA